MQLRCRSRWCTLRTKSCGLLLVNLERTPGVLLLLLLHRIRQALALTRARRALHLRRRRHKDTESSTKPKLAVLN